MSELAELQAAYAKYVNGDWITDREIHMMLGAINNAMPMMKAHPHFAIALSRLDLDREALEGYLNARRARPVRRHA